ncbi:MAG: hypothetical protein KGI75_30355, partial [Rhizobiaceae bacterium]|nr:hypothetical protein [Rhizobiaceae bacterium]
DMANLTIAASEGAFIRLFNAIRDNFTFADSDSVDFGPFTAGYDIAFHLENGSVDLRSDNTVKVSELDIKWDKLDLFLGIDIPSICIGGWCIIPTPFGCALRLPRVCIFDNDPDIGLTLPLGGITSEVSLTGRLVMRHFDNPARPPGMNAWDAQDAVPSLASEWRLFFDDPIVDIDPIDIADTVGDLLEAAADAAIDSLLSFLPGWARDIIKGIIGSAIDIVRAILDIPDDIQEWISDLLNVSFGLLDIIAQFIIDYFGDKTPLTSIEDPYPLLPATANPNSFGPAMLIPVKVPIRKLNVFNTDVEMILEADIG